MTNRRQSNLTLHDMRLVRQYLNGLLLNIVGLWLCDKVQCSSSVWCSLAVTVSPYGIAQSSSGAVVMGGETPLVVTLDARCRPKSTVCDVVYVLVCT